MFSVESSFRSTRGGNARNSRCTHPDRERRQAAAKVRQAAYDKLSLQEKLNGLIPDGSNRQRERLMAKLTVHNLAMVTKAEAKKK